MKQRAPTITDLNARKEQFMRDVEMHERHAAEAESVLHPTEEQSKKAKVAAQEKLDYATNQLQNLWKAIAVVEAEIAKMTPPKNLPLPAGSYYREV